MIQNSTLKIFVFIVPFLPTSSYKLLKILKDACHQVRHEKVRLVGSFLESLILLIRPGTYLDIVGLSTFKTKNTTIVVTSTMNFS